MQPWGENQGEWLSATTSGQTASDNSELEKRLKEETKDSSRNNLLFRPMEIMLCGMKSAAQIRRQYAQLRNSLDERARREWAGAEAVALGHGGIVKVHRAMGMAPYDWQGRAGVTGP